MWRWNSSGLRFWWAKHASTRSKCSCNNITFANQNGEQETHERLRVFKKFLREKENKNFFNIIHLLLRRINFFTMYLYQPFYFYASKCIDLNDYWSTSKRELYDLEAVRSVSSRALTRGRFRLNERRSLLERKEPRSITSLQERRKSIDLRTEVAAPRPRDRRWIRSFRHRARVSPRHANYLGESIFSKVCVRTEVVSVYPILRHYMYKYNNISWHFSVWNGTLYHFITEIARTRCI